MLVAIAISGIANRIKCIVSVLRLSNDPKIYWTSILNSPEEINTLSDPGKLSDVFDMANIEVKEMPNENKYYSWRLAVLPSDKIPNNFSEYHDKKSNKDHTDIDLAYEKIPIQVRNEYINAFKKLKINSSILEEVDEFTKKNFNEHTISIHARSWIDTKPNNPRRKRFIENYNKYFEEADKYVNLHDDAKIFIASDSFKIIEEFKEKYKEKLVVYDRPNTSFRNDMVTILLLSKNPIIIGTYLSTFTEVSWWFSECKSKVIII